MSGDSGRGTHRGAGLVATVAVAEYAEPARPGGRTVLSHVEGVRERFADLARDRLGFGRRMRLDGTGTTREALWAGLDAFRADGARRKILYWTGHGVDRGDSGYYLACSDTWASGAFDAEHAVPVTELVDRLLDAAEEADTLLVVDACSAHGHLPRALEAALSKDRSRVRRAYRERTRGFVVVGTSGVGRVVPEGRWVEWLEQVLGDPGLRMRDEARPLDPSALYLPVEYLLEGLDAAAAASGLDEPEERPGSVEVRSLPNSFLRNPYYAEAGEVRGTALLTADDPYPWLRAEHFGLEDGGELERSFTGRHGPLSRVVRWLETCRQGLLAVTGPAGCGKTALLGRLALMSVPRKCDRLDPPPPWQIRPRPGSVHALMSCRGQSLSTLTRAVWKVLGAFDGMPRVPAGAVTCEQLLSATAVLVGRAGALNLVFDALDEALPEQSHEIARHLLNPLARTAGVKVVVGTRPQPRQQSAYREPDESLLETLDRTAHPLVLDEDEGTERDIADMVEAVLARPGSPYAARGAQADRAAAAVRVAEESGRLFLIARLFAAELARRAERVPEDRLAAHIRAGGAGLRDRLAQEVAQLGARGVVRVAEFVRPLALVQGRGLSLSGERDRELWLRAANALRDDGTRELAPGQLRSAVTAATGSLVSVQPEPEGQASYALAHPGYGAYLLESAGIGADDGHRRIVRALRAGERGRWADCHPYTRRHLGAHAAQAGQGLLEGLFDDPEFLVHTDPDVLLPLTTGLLRVCEGAALYARVADVFRFRDGVRERRALLLATAFVSHRDTLYPRLLGVPGFAALPWREVWSDAPPEGIEVRWPAPLGGARALSWTAAGRGRSVSVGGQGEIVVQDADTGKRLLTRRTGDGPGPGGRREALTEVRELGEGAHRVTAARDSRAVYFWVGPERLPSQVYRWGGAPHGLALERCGGADVAVVADGRLTWSWCWPYRGRPADGSLAEVSPAPAGRIALCRLGGRGFLLLADRRTTLRELLPRARGGGPLLGRAWPLADGGRPVYAAAALTDPETEGADGTEEGGADGGTVGAEGGPGAWLAAADGVSVTVWRLSLPGSGDEDGAPHREALPPLSSNARGLALGRLGGRPVIALHEGGSIRVRGLRDDTLECVFPLRSQRDPEALAFDPGGSGLVAVGDGPDVRLLDVASAVRAGSRGRRRDHHERPVPALAAGPRPDSPLLLCRAWGREVVVGTVGGRTQPVEPVTLRHDEPVTAVRAVWDGTRWAVAVAAGRQVRLWRLSPDLTECHGTAPAGLGGDPRSRVPSLGLTADGAGLSLFAPAGGTILCRRMSTAAGAPDGWGPERTVRAGLLVCGLTARTLGDGGTWVAADLGERLVLWRATADGLVRAGTTGLLRPTAPVVLGEHTEDGESVPLLAWAEEGTVKVTEWAGGRWRTESVSVGTARVSALAFTGSGRRPLLLVAGGARPLAVWDVRRGDWVPEAAVPYRGPDVTAVESVPDGEEAVTVALQSSQRCDVLRLRTGGAPSVPTRRRTPRL
ncbi:peptidase C14 caspase catalytic subunit p20 [Streptomyces uncialis]|uniref:peptidase C14 caspase catalytic subunit p20 n=1 Tax=Streptomyces uncialis TaxID=1048205 RepID=UPI00386B87D6|nr:ATP-binding protein [Streptomyces uncialis]